jgi:hypothetical protein
VLPSAALQTVIPTDEYRLGLKFWLGLPLVDPAAPAPSCPLCRVVVDAHGDHLLCCKHNNYALRHNAVQDAFCALLSEAGVPFQKEVAIPGQAVGGLRPADALAQFAKPLAVDVTIGHGWQASERVDAATLAGRGDATREKWRRFLIDNEGKKHAKYDVACAAAGWDFTPMAFGTWGGVGPEAAKLLARIIGLAAGWREVDLRPWRKEELRQRFFLALYRQVCRLLGAVRLLM